MSGAGCARAPSESPFFSPGQFARSTLGHALTRAPRPHPPHARTARRAHKLRQVRPFHGPEETLRAPATGLQDIGFTAHEAKAEKRWVKNHCEETKFKCELIKAGIYV